MSTQVQFKDYSMGFKDDDGKVYNLIDHLNMQLDEGKALGIVGESGCGKSMTSLSLMRLLPAAASVQGGEILLNGEDLLKKSEPEMEKIRGKQIAMIFQEPMTALNDAVNALDYPVLQGAFLVMAVAVVIMSFLTDLVVAWLDPRIKLGG